MSFVRCGVSTWYRVHTAWTISCTFFGLAKEAAEEEEREALPVDGFDECEVFVVPGEFLSWEEVVDCEDAAVEGRAEEETAEAGTAGVDGEGEVAALRLEGMVGWG